MPIDVHIFPCPFLNCFGVNGQMGRPQKTGLLSKVDLKQKIEQPIIILNQVYGTSYTTKNIQEN